jgi:hypothetical protein
MFFCEAEQRFLLLFLEKEEYHYIIDPPIELRFLGVPVHTMIPWWNPATTI